MKLGLQQVVHAPDHHFPELPSRWVVLAIRAYKAAVVHGKSPVVVHPLHIVRATLNYIAKLVATAVDLLTCELNHHNGVLLQELEVY